MAGFGPFSGAVAACVCIESIGCMPRFSHPGRWRHAPLATALLKTGSELRELATITILRMFSGERVAYAFGLLCKVAPFPAMKWKAWKNERNCVIDRVLAGKLQQAIRRQYCKSVLEI